MKSRSVVGLALLTASVLASPVLSFAGSQPARVYTPDRNEAREAVHRTRAVDERATGAKAPRSEKGIAQNASGARASRSDSAFRK